MEVVRNKSSCKSQSSSKLFRNSSSPSPSYKMTVQGKIFRPWDQSGGHDEPNQNISEVPASGEEERPSSAKGSVKAPVASTQDSWISLKKEVKACRNKFRQSESSNSRRSCPAVGSSSKDSYEDQFNRPQGPQSSNTSLSEPLSPLDSDFHASVSRGGSPSNLFLYPMAINELANLSRNELTAIGLLPPEPPGSQKVKRQRPKRFHCPHCQVAFSNNGQLRGHIRIHTGERPFVCEHESCGKSFTRNEELTRHRRIHTGLRPYPCTYCGKKFGRKDHLKKHTRTHQRVMYAPPSVIGYGSPFQPFHPPILSTAISPDLAMHGVSPFGFPMMPSLSTAHYPPL